MKTKTFTLVLVAIVFAAGSAFTSKKADRAPNVYVRWKQTSVGNFLCTMIPRECAASGVDCQVTITKADATNETVPAYDAANCVVVLKHNGPFPPTFDAGVGNRPFDVE
jgi:hypothetical protein